MQLIEAWFEKGKNFYIGRALYASIGRKQAVKDLLAKGKSPLAQEALENALQELLESNTASVASVADKPGPKAEDTEKMPESTDAVLQALRNEWLPLYQHMNYLRHSLDQFTGNFPEMIEKRKPIAFEILALDKKINQLWDRKKYYEKHGKLPFTVEQDALPMEPTELAITINNLKRYIRRHANNMRKKPGNATYAQKYKHYKELYKLATGKEYNDDQSKN